MPHFQILMFVKPFQMLHCPSRSPEFHIKGVSAKQTHDPWWVWWQGPRSVLKQNVQKLFLGPWNVQKLLLPIATSFSVAGFPSTIALQRPRLGQSGVLPGAFLDLTYHNGWCHCEYQVASHVIDACDVAILEFVKNTVVPNLFVNWWCLVSFPHCIDHYFWTILSRVALHRKGEDPWVAQPCWVVQEITVWFGLEKSANAHLRIG